MREFSNGLSGQDKNRRWKHERKKSIWGKVSDGYYIDLFCDASRACNPHLTLQRYRHYILVSERSVIAHYAHNATFSILSTSGP